MLRPCLHAHHLIINAFVLFQVNWFNNKDNENSDQQEAAALALLNVVTSSCSHSKKPNWDQSLVSAVLLLLETHPVSLWETLSIFETRIHKRDVSPNCFHFHDESTEFHKSKISLAENCRQTQRFRFSHSQIQLNYNGSQHFK